MSGLDVFGFGEGGWGLSFLAGAAMTVLVSAAALLFGAVIGALAAWGRLSGNKAAGALSVGFSAIFRGVPELLVVYFVYFGSSALLTAIGNTMGVTGFIGMPAFLAGVLAVGVISGAYQGEVYRGGYLAVARGEIEAAQAIGMSRFLSFRRIIAPQVLRFAIPGLGNLWQMALKDSSLISVTGLAELMRVSQVGAASSHRPFAFYIGGCALYLIVTSITNRLFDAAERHATRGLKQQTSER
jgi:octopine/nopaline transport system permease protein